jgi:N-acetylglucosaminyldiphosphoundecaprenol N-acetyl-beta-D-mannosaminyltransferase
MLSRTRILGVDITNETSEEILEYLLQRLKLDKKFYIVTPNPELLVIANKSVPYKNVLNNAEISLADGAGLFVASIILGKPLKQRIPGVDFMEFICKNIEKKPLSIGLLGGRAGVAEKTAECLLKKYPGLNIAYVSEEWDNTSKFKVHSSKLHLKNQNVQRPKTKDQRPMIDILFVALGSPKQEEWIYKNLDTLPVKAAMGVGGAFDFIAGRVHRAPLLIRAIGFEWLYRLIREPWRARRQLALLTFIKLVVRERF